MNFDLYEGDLFDPAVAWLFYVVNSPIWSFTFNLWPWATACRVSSKVCL